MGKIPNWFRWFLFLPVAFITMIFVYPIINILSYIFSVGEYDFLDEIWAVILGSGFTGFCFVYLGSLTAPKYQMIVAVVLTALYGIISGFMLTSKIFLGESASSSWFQVISIVVVGIIGSIIACYQIYVKKVLILEIKDQNTISNNC